jgi:hypothetical protein
MTNPSSCAAFEYVQRRKHHACSTSGGIRREHATVPQTGATPQAACGAIARWAKVIKQSGAKLD